MDRSRFTLPPFGGQATLPLWQDWAELFTGIGGVNAWKPDNTLVEPNRRGTSFNDAWFPLRALKTELPAKGFGDRKLVHV